MRALDVRVRKMSEHNEYFATCLSHYGNRIKGKLMLFSDRVVFEPRKEEVEEIEIPVAKIRDARLSTQKDISAAEALLFGPTFALLGQREHKLMTIDYEDELGIMKHLTFEGEYMVEAVEDLYDIRREEKLGPKKRAESVTERKFRRRQWQCKRCMRVNAATANLCTRCGESRT